MRALANFWVCRSWQGNGLRTGSFLARRCGTVGKKFVEYVEASVIRATLRVPVPLAGKWEETERTRAGATSRAAPRPAHGHRVSTTVLAGSRPEPAHNRCLRRVGATPAATRRRRSAARGTGWPRNRYNWCGRSATHAVP